MSRLPPALAASATPRILEELGEPPARVLELGFAGHPREPLRLAGFEVVVVEPDPAYRAAARASARARCSPSRRPTAFDAVVAPAGADLTGVDARASRARRAGWLVWSSAWVTFSRATSSPT